MKLSSRISALQSCFFLLALCAYPSAAAEQKTAPAKKPAPAVDKCVECHLRVTPNVVSDWKLSKHSTLGIGCDACHGTDHTNFNDPNRALVPTPETCGDCHAARVEQFKEGKHALAWAAMKAMPTIHCQPMAMTEGMKGCGGCHKIGLKTPERDHRRS